MPGSQFNGRGDEQAPGRVPSRPCDDRIAARSASGFRRKCLGRGAGIADGRESFDKALHRRSGYRLDDFRPIEDTKAVTVPTLVAQVHDDFTMPPSYVQEIYDNISAEDKKLFWIEGTDLRFQGYNYFGEHPELVLEWFDTHM
jgi:hypothetical protein